VNALAFARHPSPAKTSARSGRNGLPRRLFTAAEFEAMVAADVLDDMKRLELLEGELVPKVGTGPKHARWHTNLLRILARGLPDELAVAAAYTTWLDDMPDPDIAIVQASVLDRRATAGDLLLAVEISDTSLRKDLRVKAPLYARAGVPHYWVLDARKRQAHVHSDPGPGGYASIQVIGGDGALTLPFEPGTVIRLGDLG
jgi:Uma2 family endonuclease